ncbi:MAG: penicillin-binding protein 2 [Anaerolineae bacterium]
MSYLNDNGTPVNGLHKRGLRKHRESDSEASRPPWIQRAPRVAVVGWVILLVLGLYLIRLWQLQFLEGGAWQTRAERQQSRLDTVSPSRGVIYDRSGEILVRNIPAYNVTITPGLLPEDAERERSVLMRLAQLLDVPYSTTQGLDIPEYQGELRTVGRATFPPYGESPAEGLLEMVEKVRWLEPYSPIVVEQNIDRDLALLIAQEGSVTMPGVGIEITPRRNYIYGPQTSQILGFLQPIPSDQVAEYEGKGYNPNTDRIGYAGVEAQMEEFLRGTPGQRMVEKDVLGQELQIISETPPSPGDNVYLTLDMELQKVAEDALRAGLEGAGSRRGVVVILDPRDGQVLSIVSLPTYDNNMFSGRLDMDAYRALLSDPHYPLINHAIADQVPPGSIFKIIPATAALQEGVINRYTIINDPGMFYLPNKFAPDNPELAQPFYCWIYLQYGTGHGPMNVVDALAQSCDTFFYQVAGGYEETKFEGLGIDRLAAYAQMFGLGALTQIDIPGEATGLVPTPAWKRQTYQETWTTGDTYITGIGQGNLLATPLQMTNAFAIVANGGTLYAPQLIHHVADTEGNIIRDFTPKVIDTLDIAESVWQIVREGLDLAVSEEGTGKRADIPELGINVAGKTGTAEYCDDIALKAGRCDVAEGRTLPTHAWFAAYAPFEAPEIVVVAWIYDGGEGSTRAAPVVHDILDFYFRRSLGLLDQPEGDASLETTPTEAAP